VQPELEGGDHPEVAPAPPHGHQEPGGPGED
jgi:hypothetical protein